LESWAVVVENSKVERTEVVEVEAASVGSAALVAALRKVASVDSALLVAESVQGASGSAALVATLRKVASADSALLVAEWVQGASGSVMLVAALGKVVLVVALLHAAVGSAALVAALGRIASVDSAVLVAEVPSFAGYLLAAPMIGALGEVRSSCSDLKREAIHQSSVLRLLRQSVLFPEGERLPERLHFLPLMQRVLI
jgi:hypothetical protein